MGMIRLAAALGVLAAGSAGAAELTVVVSDADGRPLAEAVVSVAAPGAPAMPVADPPAPLIDQRDETFLPLVQVVHRGGTLRFRNSDPMRHHVYSFSPVKAFEFVVAPGDTSAPVRFERSGVAAIGCNIHDQMVAYVYVTDAPWTAQTGVDGRAVIAGLPEAAPEGGYELHAWHPRLRPGRPEHVQPLAPDAIGSRVAVTLETLRERRSDPDRRKY